jgi:hypothetical protein
MTPVANMVPMGSQAARLAGVVTSGTGSDPGGFSAAARKHVRHILAGSQYQSRPERSFQPLAGALGAIGRWFERVFGPPWRWIAHHLLHPVGTWFTSDLGLPWPIAVLVVALIAGVALGVIRIRRRPRIGFDENADGAGGHGEDPRTLEKLAQQAELAGDLRAAIRLRFRAGIADLDRLGVISRGPTRTTRELSDTLSSAQFDALAADLEAIVYGGVAPTPEQAAHARSGWSVVKSQAMHHVEPLRSAGPVKSAVGSGQ